MPKVEAEIVVQAPVDVVYGAWRNFENFPRFMDGLEDVRVFGSGRSHWKAGGMLGTDAEWDAELTLDQPNRAIAWHSLEGRSVVTAAGHVEFFASGDATILEVSLEYDAPPGEADDVVAKLFSDPEGRVEADLERFKEAIEQGPERSGLTFSDPDRSARGSIGTPPALDQRLTGRMHGDFVGPAGVDDAPPRSYTGEDFGYSSRGLSDD